MKSELQMQKMEMQLAINWMTTIEACDLFIEAGTEVDFYKEKRQTAIKGYVAAMEAILDTAITISNRKFQQVA